MIIDKLNTPVQRNNNIAISELKLNEHLVPTAHLVFAKVLDIKSESLSIRYESGMIDNEFTNKEFIILPENKDSLYTAIESLAIGYVG